MQKLKAGYFLVLILLSQLSGCASVEPWEKSAFAREDMQLAAEELDLALDDHIYFSKEGASGGRSFSGGGCGCN
ncbi:DUF4266 domain-containing protein [Shewanella sp.]|uniref:DUF4266 domain-containing protein n=1 Tax=Shewanella sp. TaxID=50422 RepID=UPI0035626F2A